LKRGEETTLRLSKRPGLKKGEILHELMHTLGFLHEHQRIDRDRYVEVKEEIIDYKVWDYQHHKNYICHGIYDADSVMHYTWNEIISPKKNGNLTPEQVRRRSLPETFSKGDIKAINFLTGRFSCTFKEYKDKYVVQAYFECITCWGKDSDAGCCVDCRYSCHRDHEVVYHSAIQSFFCDCGQNGCVLKCTSNSTKGTPCMQPEYQCNVCNVTCCHPCSKLFHLEINVVKKGTGPRHFECRAKTKCKK